MNEDMRRVDRGRRQGLAALHGTARLLRRHDRSPDEVLQRVAELIPGSCPCPEITEARVEYGKFAHSTAAFRDSRRMQTEKFVTSGGTAGRIDVVCLEDRPEAVDGPFLSGVSELIRAIAELLRSYFDHQEADAEIERARDRLDLLVRERTAELQATNAALERQVEMHRDAERKIARQRARLRALAREAALAEQRQRRAIASDLHDHLGQALAFIRMGLAELQGDMIFSGVEGRLDPLLDLLDKAIQYTRTLTAEISPPILYDLGLLPAVEWLADEMRRKHDLPVAVKSSGKVVVSEEAERVMLFLALRELLVNCVKHADASRVTVEVLGQSGSIRIRVADDGAGFEPDPAAQEDGFGLFSVAERIRGLGGTVEIDSAPGRGTRVEMSVPVDGSRP